MPYIKQPDRMEIDANLRHIRTAGELNYRLTTIIEQYLLHKGVNYQTMNDIVGALEGAKLEFYARMVRPYEEQKMKENGDVYVLGERYAT